MPAADQKQNRHGGQSDAPDPEEPWQHAGEKIVHRKPHIIVMGDVKTGEGANGDRGRDANKAAGKLHGIRIS